MKKDRNCSASVAYNPVYPTYPMMQGPAMPGIMPGIPNAMPMPTMPTYGYVSSAVSADYNNAESQINNLSNQINNLERRVSRLENMANSSSTSYNSKYNSSNYQMM